ncbi:MAG: SprT-like domain-containing protein [Polyangiaceae bacterium]
MANARPRSTKSTEALPEGVLRADLERALVRELLATWKQLNVTYFRAGLRVPSLELGDADHRLGQWHRMSRSIEISRRLVLERPWNVVVEVMKHEMAHQYVHEVLHAVDEAAHGPAFRTLCARLGIDARASGMPTGASDDAPEEGRIVEKITRLLALAGSSNRNEAEAAAAAAQKLMLKYNLDAAKTPGTATYAFRQLGEPTGRVGESERILAHILGKFFFVEVIWVPVYRPLVGKRGSALEIAGSSSNLAIAEYVHAFLRRTADDLWAAHKKEAGIASDRDRRTYLAGVMSGFHEKLARESQAHKSAGLVWVKDADLGSYFRRRHPYIRHVRHEGHRKNDAYAQGKEAGRGIVLKKGMGDGPSGGRKLLPPRGADRG